MFRAFIDESGNDPRDPVLVCGAWVGSVGQWDGFADEWQTALIASNPKPLVPYEGYVYFKHSEARARVKCFAGFTDKEAEEKTVNLAKVIARYEVGALATVLRRKQYYRIVEEMAIKKSGRLYKEYIKDPLFSGMHGLIGLVLGTQYTADPNDKVDFIVDEGGMTNRVISMYEFIRENIPSALKTIMGTAIPVDDKQVMPLQAADLLAGQIRMATQYQGHPRPLLLLRQNNSNWIHRLGEKDIRIILSTYNVAVSTRRLVAIKDERASPRVMSKRRVKQKKGNETLI